MTPLYAELLEKGLAYQDFATDLFYKHGIPLVTNQSKANQLTGENKAGIEIKFDDRFHETGNLYIEISERSRESLPFTDSGIYRNDNSWLYAIGDYRILFVFSKKGLRVLHQRQGYREVGNPTSKGFLVPEIDAQRYAIKVMRATNDNSPT